jgi:hypothetical protein
MTGYLTFLRSLTDLQQKHCIGVLIRSRAIKPVAEEMLKHPTVVEFNELLGWQPRWKSVKDELDTIEIGTPCLTGDLCTASITFQYVNLQNYIGSTVSNTDYHLTVTGVVYIDDEGEPMIGTVTCVGNQGVVNAEKEALSELKKGGYLNYLRALTPDKQRDALWDLSVVTWGLDNAGFVCHGQVGRALGQAGIELIYSEHEVGPVQLAGDYGTASMSYTFYGYPAVKEEEISEAACCVEVHILASISDVLESGIKDVGAQLTIKELCFSIMPVQDHEQRTLMIVS